MVTKKSSKKAVAKKTASGSAKKSAGKPAARRVAPQAVPAPRPIFRDSRLSIRMYRHGLGDCLLLRFAKESDEGTYNVLIDCGLIGVASEPKKKMTAVVDDIDDACDGRIDLAIMTHEHWDHSSGYSDQQVRARFDKLDIREVWYAWTEDPSNDLGKKLRQERAAKVQAVAMAAGALDSIPANALAASRSAQLVGLLGYFGVDLATIKAGAGSIGKTRAAFEYLAQRPGVRVRYKHPKDSPSTLPGVENVRVYVFGPPEDEVLLKKSRPTKTGREVYELTTDLNVATNLDRAFSRLAGAHGVGVPGGGDVSAADCPFDESLTQRTASPELAALRTETWDAPEEEWRRIDLDWTRAAENLAIDLDSHTNNSCLVLAFEFVDTGQVFLFPGDAQVGNWLSWESLTWQVRGEAGVETVSAHDLLARTVFYKVGHHGSHNATLRALGLELMNNEELTAFIPVQETEALKNRWKEMPFKPLVRRLLDKTRGRLLRTDDTSPPKGTALAQLSALERKRFQQALTEGEGKLYYELSFD